MFVTKVLCSINDSEWLRKSRGMLTNIENINKRIYTDQINGSMKSKRLPIKQSVVPKDGNMRWLYVAHIY
jgi:hypothetical protein